MSETQVAIRKKSVLLTSFGNFLYFRHYNCKDTTFFLNYPRKTYLKVNFCLFFLAVVLFFYYLCSVFTNTNG